MKKYSFLGVLGGHEPPRRFELSGSSTSRQDNTTCIETRQGIHLVFFLDSSCSEVTCLAAGSGLIGENNPRWPDKGEN